MKRSELNKVIKDAIRFVESKGLHFPGFAKWSPEDWKKLDQTMIIRTTLSKLVMCSDLSFLLKTCFDAKERGLVSNAVRPCTEIV